MKNATAGDIKGGLATPTTQGSAQNKNGTKEGKPNTIASSGCDLFAVSLREQSLYFKHTHLT